jgi:hypothetical protein
LAISHDIATNTTNALMLGLRTEEIDVLVDTLKVSRDRDPFYILLPSILMDRAVDVLSIDAEARRSRLIQIAQTTGLHAFNRFGSVATHHNEQEEILDLEITTHRLTSLSDACAGIDAVCTTQNLFIDAITTMDHDITEARDPQKSDGAAVFGISHQRLMFIGQLLRGIETKVRYTKASAQGQVQTVVLPFPPQNDLRYLWLIFSPSDVQSHQPKR